MREEFLLRLGKGNPRYKEKILPLWFLITWNLIYEAFLERHLTTLFEKRIKMKIKLTRAITVFSCRLPSLLSSFSDYV